MPLRIGLDLDNTLISYDRAFAQAARSQLLCPADAMSKQQIAAYLRGREGGEAQWQKLQGHVYGKGIAEAELFDGALAFLRSAAAQNATLSIVSHKTEFGHFDEARVNLRDAARGFLRAKGVFSHVPEAQVFFCNDRAEKLRKIAELSCGVFVDDLEEVLSDAAFPPATRRILFTPAAPAAFAGGEVARSWSEIERMVFHVA